MFSQTVQYALRAMVALAHHPEGPVTGRQIADEARIPPKYLTKVLQALARAGLVTAVRGIGGGYTLNATAEQVSMLEVINSVDPIERIRRCPIDRPDHKRGLCPLHRRLDRAIAEVETAFRGTSLAELLEDPKRSPLPGPRPSKRSASPRQRRTQVVALSQSRR